MPERALVRVVERRTATPPYISFQTLRTFVLDSKEHGLPNRIDRSVLTRFSGGVGGQLMTALSFLELVDEDKCPTALLRRLVEAFGTAEWSKTLEAMLKSGYPEVFQINLETASPAQFTEHFRKLYPAKEDTLRKCIGFFLSVAKDAGIQISPYITKGMKTRGPNVRKKIRRLPTKSVPAIEEIPFEQMSASETRDNSLHPFIQGLLGALPQTGEKWPQRERAKWLTLAANAFDLIYHDGEDGVVLQITASKP